MSLTLGLTGMDSKTEAELKAAFETANASLGGQWQLVSENEASHVVIDMDSMYGPMSWLKLHGAGKSVIGLTSAPRSQADVHLQHPFTADTLAKALQDIAGSDESTTPTPAPAPEQPADNANVAPEPIPDAADTDATDTNDTKTEAAATPATPQAQAHDATVDTPPAAADETTSTPGAEAPDEPEAPKAPAATESPAEAEPAPPPRDPVFADWLAPGKLPEHVRYQHGDGPTLLIDTETNSYHGPAMLKPLMPYFTGTVVADDFTSLDDDAWAREVAALGESQSLMRLIWLGGLLAGGGALLPGMDPDGQYRLGKWPQTEREFPKHFRIATAMMKAPATVTEIAQASGVGEQEVADFINANLATGFAEPYVEPVEEPVEKKTRSSRLLQRLRGK